MNKKQTNLIGENPNLLFIRSLPNNWRVERIESLCEKITSGGTPSRRIPEYYQNGTIRWIKTKELKDWYIEDSEEKITVDALNNSSAKILPVNTVLMAMYGDGITITSLAILRKTSSTNQACCALIPNSKACNHLFLFYSLKYHRNDFIHLASGGSQRNLNSQIIRNFQIRVPPLPTQQKIASILSAYDDLIENNTRRIKILEEMAQTLYSEWFVKFRFPGYEQVKMVESELGLIPEGWEVKKLEQLGLLARGKSKHRPRNDPSLYGGKYPFIQTGEVKEANLFITNYSQTYSETGLAQSKLWEVDTLLITIAANIAETAIITFQACFPDSIVGFIPDSNKASVEFIKYSIDNIKLRMQNVSKGTTQDNLSLEKIRIFDFLLPDSKTMQLFKELTNPIFLQIKNLLLKNQNLRQTRDLLLPKLISGEIDVENLDIETKPVTEAVAA